MLVLLDLKGWMCVLKHLEAKKISSTYYGSSSSRIHTVFALSSCFIPFAASRFVCTRYEGEVEVIQRSSHCEMLIQM